MAEIEIHIRDCEGLIGDGWREVHLWIDAFIEVDGAKWHRKRRHHKEGVEEVRALWGDDGAVAAEIHIRRDFHGYIPNSPDDWGRTVGPWDELLDDKLVDEKWKDRVRKKINS